MASACRGTRAITELFLEENIDPALSNIVINSLHIPDVSEHVAFNITLQDHIEECRHFYTKKGYLGYRPKVLEEGDLICVFPNCRLPIALRKVEDYYHLVGTCFVLGLIDGEAAKILECREVFMQQFNIH
jgi:hypothetical protein